MGYPYLIYISFTKKIIFRLKFNKDGFFFNFLWFNFGYWYKNKYAYGYYVFGKEFKRE